MKEAPDRGSGRFFRRLSNVFRTVVSLLSLGLVRVVRDIFLLVFNHRQDDVGQFARDPHNRLVGLHPLAAVGVERRKPAVASDGRPCGLGERGAERLVPPEGLLPVRRLVTAAVASRHKAEV